MKTIPLGPFLGLNNRLPDFALHVDKKGDYLSLAENIDVDSAGSLRRRESESLIQAMTAPHSLYMTSDTAGYLVRGSVLYAITLPAYAETFAKSLTSNARMSWCEEGPDLYFSNGTDSGRITDGSFFPLGLPTPSAPGVAAIAGTMLAGAYQVAVSYSNAATGEEGGVSPARSTALATDGGLEVTLPGAVAGATHINVYVSTVNGSIPMLAGSYVIGTASASFPAAPTTLREAPERFEAPLPAGNLFMSNGRLCSFTGDKVYVGLPHRYGYYDIVGGWIAFKDNVTVAIENQGGTYIAADVTYWIPGDLGNVEGAIATVLPYGAVPGTEFRNDSNSTVGWFGQNGYVIGATSGEVQAVMTDNIDLDAPATGCSLVRSTNGYQRVIGSGWCLNLENMAATEYAGFDFTSLSGDYGTKADGVYCLTGGGDVEWLAGLGKQNFGSEQIKTMPAIYLGCSSPEPLTVRIQTADEDDYSYDARSCSDKIKQHRVDPGLGLESNWFDLELMGKTEFELATVSFAPTASTRRI